MKTILLFLLFISTWASAQVRIATTTGTDLYDAVFTPPLTSFNTATVYVVTFTNANTTPAVTLDPAGVVAATAIKDNGGNALGVGVIKAGATHTLKFDGTNLRAIDVSGNAQNENTTWVTKTGNYTPVAADTLQNIGFLMTSSSAVSFTIPSSLTLNFSIGTPFTVRNNSTGLVSILESPGVDFKSITSGPWALEEDEYAELSKIGTDTWSLVLFKRPNLSTETTVAVFTDLTEVGNVTTGEDVLFTYTLEGGTLSTDGNAIRGRFSGQTAVNGNTKVIVLNVGDIIVATRGSTTPTISQGWTLDWECIRTSQTTQWCNASYVGTDGLGVAWSIAGTEDLSEDVVITLTGEATATNDIIKRTATGTFAPGAGGSTPPPIEPPEIPFLITDNAIKGTDGYEHTYVGTWPENSTSPLWYSTTQTNSSITNDYVELKFNGTEIHWFTEVAAHLGIAAVSIDGGAETNVDLYNATQSQQVNVWSSGTLTQAEHTVKIRVTGTKNASSTGVYIGHDYLKTDNNEDVAPTPGVDEAERYVATTGSNTANNCSNIASPCLTVAYTATQATSGDLIQIGPGTFTETSYIIVPLNVDIRGSGIDITVVKGASGLWDDFDDYDLEYDKSLFQYSSGSEANGEQYLKDLTIDGTGTAYNDGGPITHSTLLNDRGMYGGVWINNRNNVTIDGIKVRKCFFDAVMMFNTKFSKVLNSTFIDNAYGQTAFASGNVMWGGDYNEDMEIAGCTVNEGFGNGMKAFASQVAQGRVERFKVHGNNISVTPTGQWAGGGAKNIAFENWGVVMEDCELYDNYFDGNVNLINNDQDDDAVNTIHVYNNTFDMITRAHGESYPMELGVSYAEIDHNYFIGGKDATIANFQGNTYPTLSPWYGFWNFHHNVIIAPQGGNPSMLFYIAVRGLHQTNIYNNTIEVDNIAGDNQTSHRTFCFVYSAQVNAASANNNIKNNAVWDKSNGTSAPFSNRVWFMNTGGTVASTSVTHNDFFSLSANPTTGITYSNNITTDPQMNKTGVKPDPFYMPTNGGNLNNAGTDVGLPFLGAAPDIGAFEID